jgi:hypothetical protein
MTVTGYKPLHLEGKASFEIFGFDKSKSFHKTFFEDEPPAALPLVDPLPDLLAALGDGRNWSAQLPEEASTLVTLRTRVTPGVVAVHPLGEIAVRQRVAPLNIDLDRFGQARLAGDRRFRITAINLDGEPVEALPLRDNFAAGQFLDLSDHERLSRPSFEPLEAGIKLTAGDLLFGGQAAGEAGFMVAADLEYETCILGERGECLRESQPHRPGLGVVLEAAGLGPAARAALRNSGAARYQTSGAPVQVRPPAFSIASVTDLAPADGGVGPAGRFASYTAAEQALQRRARQAPDGSDDLQVVWYFELAEENS